MNRKNGIDLFRLIAAFFVMCLHTSYGSLNHEYVDNLRVLSRWALPFFFITTGFFLGYKIEDSNLDFKRIQKNVSYLISILLVSSIIYLPIDVIKGDVPKNIESLFTGSYFHLWFIGSLLSGYIFIWYLYFIKKDKILPFISVCLLLGALFTNCYSQLLHKSLNFSLFKFLLSVPLMYIGIILSKKEYKFINNKLIIVLALMGLIIQFMESELFLKLYGYEKSLQQFLIGTIVLSVSLFVLSSRISLKENRFSTWGREYSLFIYLYHPLVYIIVLGSLHKIVPGFYDFICIISPIIGFTVTLTFSILLNRFSPKIFNIMNGSFK